MAIRKKATTAKKSTTRKRSTTAKKATPRKRATPKTKTTKVTEDAPTMTIKPLPGGGSRLRVQFDVTYHGEKGVEIAGKSKTMPNLSMRIGQLLERHTRGQDAQVRKPLYFDTPIPSFNDILDVKEYEKVLEDQLDGVRSFLRNELDELKAAEAQKKKKEEEAKQMTIDDEIKSQQAKTKTE